MKINRIQPEWGLLLLGVISVPFLGQSGFWAELEDQRSQYKALHQEQFQATLTSQRIAAQAEIAEQRYIGGCEPIVSYLDQGVARGIVEGEGVLDGAVPANKHPFEPSDYIGSGIVVCDKSGLTAVMNNLPDDGKDWAVATELAYTGNQIIVDESLDRQGFSAEFFEARQN